MAAPRLPFLYPNLLRSVRSCEPSPRSLRLPSKPSAAFHSSRRCEQDTIPRRYGPANEPRIPPELPKEVAANLSGGRWTNDGAPKRTGKEKDEKEPQEMKKGEEAPTGDAKQEARTDREDKQEAVKAEQQGSADTENPLESVMNMPSPPSALPPVRVGESRHLQPPPYVHHFDTYSLVKDLEKGGFSEAQAVTVMKAVRAILQDKLELAEQSLTSKSDIQNEQYLFKAACSELQQSLRTARNAEIQRQRASRTQLQHEFDMVNQRMNQELGNLRDAIKEMFNDHKMTTREMQRSMDTAIQELNYKITVSLNSDGKSEIEGLRWFLTRRAAMAVATCASKLKLLRFGNCADEYSHDHPVLEVLLGSPKETRRSREQRKGNRGDILDPGPGKHRGTNRDTIVRRSSNRISGVTQNPFLDRQMIPLKLLSTYPFLALATIQTRPKSVDQNSSHSHHTLNHAPPHTSLHFLDSRSCGSQILRLGATGEPELTLEQPRRLTLNPGNLLRRM